MPRKNKRRSSSYANLRQRIVGSQGKLEENMIPMINVVFLLLLYFMVAGSIQSNHDVVTPYSTRIAEPPPHIPILTVSQTGEVWFENRKIKMADLKAGLSSLSSQKKLRIHADARVDALTISKIMDISAEAGILQFVLVTQRKVNTG
jgi:biopolymer transport protein ExbD